MGMDVNGAMFTIEYYDHEQHIEPLIISIKTRLSNIKWRDYDACVKFASNSDKACKILAIDSNGSHYIQWVMGKKMA